MEPIFLIMGGVEDGGFYCRKKFVKKEPEKPTRSLNL